MATHPRSLSSLMANHLRLPTHLIYETAVFISPSYTVHLNLSVLKLPFIVKLLLLFLICFLSFLPVAFSGRLAISKRHLINVYFSFCLLSLWLSYQVSGGLKALNDLHLYLVLGVVSLLTCIVWWSSSDSLVESNICSQDVQRIVNELLKQLSVSGSYELKDDCSHLTGDSQRLEERRRIVAELEAELLSGYETPIIESDEPFVPNRELSNDTAQTEDLSGLHEDPLTEIFKKLHAFHDFAFCSTVCNPWKSACSILKWSLYPPHPWSVHFQDQNILNHLDDGKYVLERLKIPGRYYYGCVNGWILSIGSKHISIFNIFSSTQTNLPMLSPVGYLKSCITKPSDWYSYIPKFILFKACHGDNLQFLVVALFGPRGFIAFTRPQFQDWIWIQSKDVACCRDVVLLGEQFYALCGRGNLFLCGFDRSNPRVLLVCKQPAGSSDDGRYYLVKNVDHLILVFQEGQVVGFGGKRFGTKTFKIYKYDNRAGNWTQRSESTYLKDRALFIYNGNSRTIDPAEVVNCRANYIYFVDDYWFSKNGDGHCIGGFGIANGTIEDFQSDMDQYPPNNSSPFSLTDR